MYQYEAYSEKLKWCHNCKVHVRSPPVAGKKRVYLRVYNRFAQLYICHDCVKDMIEKCDNTTVFIIKRLKERKKFDIVMNDEEIDCSKCHQIIQVGDFRMKSEEPRDRGLCVKCLKELEREMEENTTKQGPPRKCGGSTLSFKKE